MKYDLIFYSGMLFSYTGIRYYLHCKNENIHNNDHKNIIQIKNKLKLNDLNEIFKAKDLIFNNQQKNLMHLSTPFNRTIKEIYNLPFYYADYENYNFNKLSDFFLNIHIFIN